MHLRKLYLGLIASIFLISCAAPAYFPTREIAFAEAAMAAARDVHAQRLASHKYQFALEALGRAKAAARAKKMGAAKRYARRARAYAEEAEEIAVMKLARVPQKESKESEDPFASTP